MTRGKRRPSNDAWLPIAGSHRAVEIVDLGAEAERTAVFLMIGSSVVDRVVIDDLTLPSANPRVSAYEVFDADLADLRAWLLNPAPSDKDRFELAVSRLLTFAGFCVDHLWDLRKKLSDAPDILAYALGHGGVMLVECTTGPLQSKEGKPSRLVQRAADVRAALASDPEAVVVPVLVTSFRQESVGPAAIKHPPRIAEWNHCLGTRGPRGHPEARDRTEFIGGDAELLTLARSFEHALSVGQLRTREETPSDGLRIQFTQTGAYTRFRFSALETMFGT